MKTLSLAALVAAAGFASAAVSSVSSTLNHAAANGGQFHTSAITTRDGGILIDITVIGGDIAVWDNLGDADNAAFVLDLSGFGSNLAINGIAWNVGITTNSPSWLSEVDITFDDASLPQYSASAFQITPGIGDDFAGASFYSNGIIKLGDAGLPDLALTNGLLYLEFSDSFDDFANGVDAFVKEGSVFTIQVIPAPGVAALLGLGGLVAARRRR